MGRIYAEVEKSEHFCSWIRISILVDVQSKGKFHAIFTFCINPSFVFGSQCSGIYAKVEKSKCLVIFSAEPPAYNFNCKLDVTVL